jgi:hypothetical protein
MGDSNSDLADRIKKLEDNISSQIQTNLDNFNSLINKIFKGSEFQVGVDDQFIDQKLFNEKLKEKEKKLFLKQGDGGIKVNNLDTYNELIKRLDSRYDKISYFKIVNTLNCNDFYDRENGVWKPSHTIKIYNPSETDVKQSNSTALINNGVFKPIELIYANNNLEGIKDPKYYPGPWKNDNYFHHLEVVLSELSSGNNYTNYKDRDYNKQTDFKDVYFKSIFDVNQNGNKYIEVHGKDNNGVLNIEKHNFSMITDFNYKKIGKEKKKFNFNKDKHPYINTGDKRFLSIEDNGSNITIDKFFNEKREYSEKKYYKYFESSVDLDEEYVLNRITIQLDDNILKNGDYPEMYLNNQQMFYFDLLDKDVFKLDIGKSLKNKDRSLFTVDGKYPTTTDNNYQYTFDKSNVDKEYLFNGDLTQKFPFNIEKNDKVSSNFTNSNTYSLIGSKEYNSQNIENGSNNTDSQRSTFDIARGNWINKYGKTPTYDDFLPLGIELFTLVDTFCCYNYNVDDDTKNHINKSEKYNTEQYNIDKAEEKQQKPIGITFNKYDDPNDLNNVQSSYLKYPQKTFRRDPSSIFNNFLTVNKKDEDLKVTDFLNIDRQANDYVDNIDDYFKLDSTNKLTQTITLKPNNSFPRTEEGYLDWSKYKYKKRFQNISYNSIGEKIYITEESKNGTNVTSRIKYNGFKKEILVLNISIKKSVNTQFKVQQENPENNKKFDYQNLRTGFSGVKNVILFKPHKNIAPRVLYIKEGKIVLYDSPF